MEHIGYLWVGKRGELTIKKKVRDIMGVKPGDYIVVSHNKNRRGITIRKASSSDLKRYGK